MATLNVQDELNKFMNRPLYNLADCNDCIAYNIKNPKKVVNDYFVIYK